MHIINYNMLIIKLCVIPKLFHKADLIGFMKLTRPKLIETIRQINEGKTTINRGK